GGRAARPGVRPRGLCRAGAGRRAHLRDAGGARAAAGAPRDVGSQRRDRAQRGAGAVPATRSRGDETGGRTGPMTRDPRRFDRSMAWLARARRVVPGASQTLSKGPSMFVEGAYPVFLDRGRGCHGWDVDGNEYVDYILGLTSIT